MLRSRILFARIAVGWRLGSRLVVVVAAGVRAGVVVVVGIVANDWKQTKNQRVQQRTQSTAFRTRWRWQRTDLQAADVDAIRRAPLRTSDDNEC